MPRTPSRRSSRRCARRPDVRRRVALVALLVLTACQQKKRRVEPPPGDEIVRGKVIATTLKKDLKAALEKELPNGAASALATCGALAPAMASSLARDGILVGRATRKPRNPKNA